MDRVEKFIEQLKITNPKIKIRFKNESKLMKFLGYLLFFNPDFKLFVTTIGDTIYFPSKEYMDAGGIFTLTIIAHEYQHILDLVGLKKLLYLLPQILAPLMLIFMLVHWALGLALFVTFLLPIPSPFRAYYEFRGYVVSLFCLNELLRERGISSEIRRHTLYKYCSRYNSHFKNSNYYWMWPWGLKEKLLDKADLILSEQIYATNPIFFRLKKALYNSKL